MKDLRPRWNVLVVLIALGTMAGSAALEARPRPPQSSNSSLLASDPSMNFGTVGVGSTTTQANYISNPTDAYVTIGKAITSGSYFRLVSPSLPVTIAPGQRAKFVFSFVPNRTAKLQGTIAIWSSAGQSSSSSGRGSENVTLRIPVAGVGATVSSSGGELGQLVAAPGSLNFGSMATGAASLSKPVVVTNSGTASVTITQAAAGGTGYTLNGPALPLSLGVGGTANFSVSFAPQSAGTATGNVVIQSNASNPTLDVGLTATVSSPSLGKLSVSSSPVTFGTIQVGKTQQQSATLTNSGGASVTVNQATVTGTGFSVAGMTMPMTLSPNQSATLSVNCAPKSAGSLSGSLTISSNASNPSVAVPLSATAVMPGDLVASASSLSFGSLQVGKTQSLPETLTNTGGTSITLSQAAAGAGFSVSGLSLPLTLAGGASTSFDVVFAPLATGNSSVNLAIINNGPTPTVTIPLSGAGLASGSLTASAVSFGSVQVGSSSTETAILSNSGGTSVTISQASLTGAGFSMSGLSTPLTLAVGQKFTFNVTFTPHASGSESGTISMVSTASGTTPSIGLSGTGTAAGQFSISPGSFAFGSITVGASKTLPVTLSASGPSITVTSGSVSSSEFTLTGPSLPLTIPSGGTASFSLTFSPESSGAATANVSFATSASSTPLSESITGTGAAAQQHSVDLSWSASSSTVSGYNIYRGSTTGGPYAKLNSAADGTLTYADASVQAGQTYFYTTTAVASDGSESAHSNEVKAVIPTP